MANVFDIAEYILGKLGFVSTMKLQKLAFYSQALSLVKTGEPLFREQFQAWVNGPVCYELFARHRGSTLSARMRSTVSMPFRSIAKAAISWIRFSRRSAT